MFYKIIKNKFVKKLAAAGAAIGAIFYLYSLYKGRSNNSGANQSLVNCSAGENIYALNININGNTVLSASELSLELQKIAKSSFSSISSLSFPIVKLPFPRNKHFFGRDIFLNAMDQSFNASASISTVYLPICGIGGIGKTQLAVEYIYRMLERKKYKVVWFFSGKDILQDYLALASALGIGRTLPDRERIEKVKNTLIQLKEWILLFDDPTDYESIKDWFPVLSGHILITTRNNRWDKTSAIDLKVFAPFESVFFLRQVVQNNPSAMEGCDSLADELNHFPLALAQAASHVRNNALIMNYKDYLDIFRHKAIELLGSDKVQDYDKTLAVTWDINYQQVMKKFSETKALLGFCACFYKTNIPIELLKKCLSPCDNVESILQELYAWSLIDRGSNEHTFSIHDLEQIVFWEKLSISERQLTLKTIMGVLNSAFASYSIVQDRYYLIPHAHQALHFDEVLRDQEYSILLRLQLIAANRSYWFKKDLILPIFMIFFKCFLKTLKALTMKQQEDVKRANITVLKLLTPSLSQELNMFKEMLGLLKKRKN